MAGNILVDGIGAGGGGDVVDDTTPQLGGDLDVNGNEITGAIDLHSTGDIIQELGDAAGTNKVIIKDSGAVEVAAIDSDGNITTSGTVDGRDLVTDGSKLDLIEASADVTDETNVVAALDGATVTTATVAVGDKVLIQDVDDADNLKTVTTQAIADLGGDMVLADAQAVTGAKTFDPSTLLIDGSTSGTTTVNATAIAGTTTLTLPAATDTLVGKATSDTLTNKTIDANGTGNSITNIDVGDLANGTDGELITWDAAGAPATVAVGTTAQVLTSNGIGAAPTFQAAAGGGAWTLIQTQEASTSSTISFSTGIDSTYDHYVIVISDVVASGNMALRMATSTDGGSTYDSGASNYAYAVQGREIGGTDSDTQNTGQTFCQIGASTHSSFSAIVDLYNPSGTSQTGWYTRFISDDIMSTGMGRRLSAADVDAIQFAGSSGTFTTGRFTLYGISHT